MDGYGYGHCDGRRALIAPLTLGHDGSAMFSGKVTVNPNSGSVQAGVNLGGIATLKQYPINMGGGIVSQRVYIGFDLTPLGQARGLYFHQVPGDDYEAVFTVDAVDCAGTLTAAGIFDSTVVSHRRYKTGIEDFVFDPDALRTLRPRRWVYSHEAPERMRGKIGAGFVADEVPTIFAGERGEGYYQTHITAQLVGGWQDHHAEIAALKARVAALEALVG